MSLLRQYLSDTKYHYRIKTVVELDDDAISSIERALAKYVPVDIGTVEKTIFQRNPMDFPGIENREVFIVDVTLQYPASSYVLQNELRYALNIPEKFIVVRGENDPIENENQRLNAEADMAEEAEKGGLERDALLNHGDYPEADEVDGEAYYGDKYNTRLTDYLHAIAQERDLEVVAANAPKPFEWLEREPKQDESDYNANITGAPSAASTRKKAKGKDAPAPDTSNVGNVNNNTKTHKRVYKSAAGSKTLSKTGVAVKKD